MKYAYNQYYVDDAMENLAEAVDYAVNACNLDINHFFDMFLVSGYSDLFGKGVPWYVCGMSGTELVFRVVEKVGIQRSFPLAQIAYDPSPEYWCGWVLAYYQWKTGRTFQEILSHVTAENIRNMYWPCHEASEDWFVDHLDAIIERKKSTSELQRIRRLRGYSQRILAEKSGINLRTLQQYEIGAKDINKASVSSVLSLAKVLGCEVEELLEKKYVEEE